MQYACTQCKPELLAAPQELHHFKWAGADVFVTASARGNRRCVVVETNSCPSGQKSQPLVNDAAEQVPGYCRVVWGHPSRRLLNAGMLWNNNVSMPGPLCFAISSSCLKAWRGVPCYAWRCLRLGDSLGTDMRHECIPCMLNKPMLCACAVGVQDAVGAELHAGAACGGAHAARRPLGSAV